MSVLDQDISDLLQVGLQRVTEIIGTVVARRGAHASQIHA